MPGFGDRTLPAPLPTGGFRRRQTHIAHALAGILKAGEVTKCGHGSDGDGALHTAQGLKRFDHWGEAPGCDLLVEFLCETLQPFRLFVARAEIFLEHDWLGRGRTDHCREPPEVSRVPGGLACRADVVPQQKGLQTQLGGFEIMEHIFTSPPQITHGFICNLGDVDGCEGARAHQPGQLECISAVRFDPIASFLRDQSGGNAPAVIAFFGQIALEPIATRTSFVDKDEAFGLRLPLPNQFIAIALTCADGAEIDDVGPRVFGGIGNRNGFFMDIQSNIKCARLGHG
jgi:hypothetical protein